VENETETEKYFTTEITLMVTWCDPVWQCNLIVLRQSYLPVVVLFLRTYLITSKFSQTIRISTAPISSAFSVSCTPKQ